MRIVVATMLWRRHDVFRVWANALLDAVRPACNLVDVRAVVAGSEGEASRDLVEGFPGFHYVEVPNRPIGRKANRRFAACHALEPDYVILCGSDDIVSPGTFTEYVALADAGWDEVAIEDIYYLNVRTGAMAYSPGYTHSPWGRAGEPIAPWRMLSWRMCEALEWHGWDDKEPRFLDSHIYRKLGTIPHSHRRLKIRDQGLFVCDLKSEVNMTAWQMRPHWKAIPPSLLDEHLSPAIVREVHTLRGPERERRELGVGHLPRNKRPRSSRRSTRRKSGRKRGR